MARSNEAYKKTTVYKKMRKVEMKRMKVPKSLENRIGKKNWREREDKRVRRDRLLCDARQLKSCVAHSVSAHKIGDNETWQE